MADSSPAKWIGITSFLNPEKWESRAGNLEGIFDNIVLPELRAERDPRLLEYWEMKIKREAESATGTRRAFDVEQFNTMRRPKLLWNQAQDMIQLGQKNRGIAQMLDVVRTYPSHPDAGGWIAALQSMLSGSAPSPAPGTTP
jgi:hypothetical protein